jgi:hypothetical protein
MRMSAMSNDASGSMPKGGSEWDTAFEAVRRLDAARRSVQEAMTGNRDAKPAEPDQVARDIAEIERVAAELRRAEPALEAWTDSPPANPRKPRSVWVIIGALWLSTALVTAGAVAAIAALVG